MTVVGIDGSISALHATRWAATEAVQLSGRLPEDFDIKCTVERISRIPGVIGIKEGTR